MAQQTSINGNRHSFVNLSVRMGNSDIPKGVFKSINYDWTQDPGIVQGNLVVPVGRTQGYATATGSYEMLISEFDDLAAALTGNGAVPLADVDFDIVVSYSINDIDVRTDMLRGCRMTSGSSQNSQGNEATTQSGNLSIMRLRKNGIDMFSDPVL